MPADIDFDRRVQALVESYFRDEVYRAPEARPEWRARLVRDLQAVVEDALVEGANLGALGARGDLTLEVEECRAWWDDEKGEIVPGVRGFNATVRRLVTPWAKVEGIGDAR